MIADLSFSFGHSVHDSISSVLASISYASVDDAVQHILHLEKDAQLVKLDLKQAYRNIPVHSLDQHTVLPDSLHQSVSHSLNLTPP